MTTQQLQKSILTELMFIDKKKTRHNSGLAQCIIWGGK